jgi:hypothetical protein
MKKITLLLLVIPCLLQAQYTLSESDVDFEGGEILEYLNETEKNIIIPNIIGGTAVTAIGSDAFSNINLTSIRLPNSITTIGDYAFSDNSLTSLNLPNELLSIGWGAFSNNILSSIDLPNSVTTIGGNAFLGNSFISFTLPTTSIQGLVYTWTDDAFSNYISGDLVIDLDLSYTLDNITNLLFSSEKVVFFYPNPSVDFIRFNEILYQLKIYNSTGILVKKFRDHQQIYNISDLKIGSYLLEAKTEDGTNFQSKLIKNQ